MKGLEEQYIDGYTLDDLPAVIKTLEKLGITIKQMVGTAHGINLELNLFLTTKKKHHEIKLQQPKKF